MLSDCLHLFVLLRKVSELSSHQPFSLCIHLTPKPHLPAACDQAAWQPVDSCCHHSIQPYMHFAVYACVFCMFLLSQRPMLCACEALCPRIFEPLSMYHLAVGCFKPPIGVAQYIFCNLIPAIWILGVTCDMCVNVRMSVAGRGVASS